MASLEHIRCRIDIIDMSSRCDGDYKHILIFQDDATKLMFLKPLQGCGACEISEAVIDIFCQFGCTLILSHRQHTFARQVSEYMQQQWNGCIVVVGKTPSHQELVGFEKSRYHVVAAMTKWMSENRTCQWSRGIRFVQWGLNNSSGHSRNSRQVQLGNERMLLGMSALLQCNVIANVQTEEDLVNALIAQES